MKRVIQLLIFVLIPVTGYCCSCSKGTTKKNYNDNQIVVTAEVVKMKRVRHNSDGNYKMMVKLKILKKYKGNESRIIRVITGNGFGDCGFRFELNKQYLVFVRISDFYSNGSKMEYISTICTRNGLIDEREEELEIIENLN